MTQGSNSTETIDRLQDLRRKIPVDHLSNRGGYGRVFEVHFREDAAKTHRKEFAALRKEFKEYKLTHHVETHNSTVGACWELHSDLLIIFADWLDFQEPLEVLMARAIQEGKEQKECEEREREERSKRYHQEQRAYRIPCLNPCKVRVSRLECVDGPGDGMSWSTLGISAQHRFSIQLDEGVTKQEKDAWRFLSKTLEEDKQNGTTGPSHRTNNIEGYGSFWRLHEYVLLAYSEWLELDDDIETLMAESVKKREQERLRWEEIRNRSSRQSFPTQAETSLSKAFTLFNLDSSATLDDVKKRYRALSKLYHPDTGGNQEEFKRLNQANQVLMQHFA